MTDAVAIAWITGGFGTLTAAMTTVTAYISRKTRILAKEAVDKVEEVHGQAIQNHDAMTKVISSADGNIKTVLEEMGKAAAERAKATWQEGYNAGCLACTNKTRRATDSKET
jgi:predicted Rossmann-fold nucleotide-binding protein